jgi:GT2 family glycosyltransferase
MHILKNHPSKLIRQLAVGLRLDWGVSYLLVAGAVCEPERQYQLTADSPELQLDVRLPSGWYMLELQMSLPSPRDHGAISLYGHDGDNISLRLSFPLFSGRLCKRLVYVADARYLSYRLESTQGEFLIQYFRLVRLTRKFALSRLMTKLQALHPFYKESSAGGRNNRRRPMTELWQDYCGVFDRMAGIESYTGWIRAFDALSDDVRRRMRNQVELFPQKPLISILLPIEELEPKWLEPAIQSVRGQIYPYWQLCIAAHVASSPKTKAILQHHVAQDSRIVLVFPDTQGQSFVIANSALQVAEGALVAFLDAADTLSEQALYRVVEAMNQHPDSRLIYSDEDKINDTGLRSQPKFKCDWNPDLFYSQNICAHLLVYDVALVRQVGGFSDGFSAAEDYDLTLRCLEQLDFVQVQHIPRVLYHQRINDGLKPGRGEYLQNGQRALQAHFRRRNIPIDVEIIADSFRVRYQLPAKPPLVSLIIPTRNGLKLLKQCLDSILEQTTYPNYEILIVDNGSDDSSALEYLQALSSNPLVRVIRDDRPFNYSALNNRAVLQARGDIIGLINNDVQVITPDWLAEMVSHVLRPEVGVVGAKLRYTDGSLQHAGVVLGLGGVAGHVHRFLIEDEGKGYLDKTGLIRSYSAVTAACLLVSKSLYLDLGGLNEIDLPVACNDVDFCIRVREAGLRIVWTPFAELYHHESASRGSDETPEKQARAKAENAYMLRRWGRVLQTDPAYSPNLGLDDEDCRLAWPPRLKDLQDNNG